jgi:hypothetical protein
MGVSNVTVTISVKVFRDDAGLPTCCKDFPAGDICQFCNWAGRNEIECALSGDVLGRRSGGNLEPSRSCPLWKEWPK